MQNWFGTRHRDAEMAHDRFAQVRATTSAAICGVNIETEDLRERIEGLRAELAYALGDLDGSYYEREAAVEKAVCFLERRLVESEKLSKDLNHQLEILLGIEKLLRDL